MNTLKDGTVLDDDYFEKLQAVADQIEQISRQPEVTVTCGCGKTLPILSMHNCLYCSQHYCKTCAEEHFGETVKEWKRREQLEKRKKHYG